MSQKLFFTPGPSQLYFTVSQHITNALRNDIGSISHRGTAFQKLFAETRESLASVLELPSGYEIYFTSSATEIWERILQNLTVESGHFFVNGSFSSRFHEFGQSQLNAVSQTKAAPGKEFEPVRIPNETELIGITLNETSTGYTFDPDVIKKVRKENPNALIALDVVSSAPGIKIDFSQVDTAYFSVQKCFGLPAGLGVWIVNDKCLEKTRQLENRGVNTGTYHTLSALKANADKNQTPETPNVLAIYLLGQVCKDMLNRGIKMIHNETIYKSTLLYQAFESLDYLSPFVDNPINRSRTVCVAETRDPNAQLMSDLSKKGLIIGAGYGNFKDTHIRIANFPTHSKEQIELLVDKLNNFASQ